jgi:predicted nucleic acid-binding protein
VLTETAWLLRNKPAAVRRIFDGFSTGFLALPRLDAEDLGAIAAILRRYENIQLQLADAALAHLADREGIETVFTLDRRDFSIIRLKQNRPLRLIPV